MLNQIINNKATRNVLISTGNILNVDNAAPLRKSDEELLESLKLCLGCQNQTEPQSSNKGAGKPAINSDTKLEEDTSATRILRGDEELREIFKQYARQEISIGVKLFLNKTTSQEVIQEVVAILLEILQVRYVDTLVLAFHPLETAVKAVPETPEPSGTVSHVTDIPWSKRNEKYIDVLKKLWAVLQQCSEKKEICQLGIADLDKDALADVHKFTRVPPTINQINLSNCCEVPPELKDFCTENLIQLLTHSDPEILISDEDFIIPNFAVQWTLRYQIHVRCRGVLAAKGYILYASKLPASK